MTAADAGAGGDGTSELGGGEHAEAAAVGGDEGIA